MRGVLVGQRLLTLLTRVLTSRDLQESQARLEEAQRVAHAGYWIWHLDTDRVTWSDETYRTFGLKPQEGPIDLATVREMIHPEDRESVFRTAEEAVLGRVRPDSEHRLVRPSGEVRTMHTVHDITDRKRAEEALQRTQFILVKDNASLIWAAGHSTLGGSTTADQIAEAM